MAYLGGRAAFAWPVRSQCEVPTFEHWFRRHNAQVGHENTFELHSVVLVGSHVSQSSGVCVHTFFLWDVNPAF